MAKKKVNYPLFKKLLWRFLRVFVGTFLAVAGMNLIKVNKVEDLIPLVLIPAFSASLATLGKYLRESLAKDNYNNLIHKVMI